MVDVSIVSGTFNRLHSLQRMVESARQSFTNGLIAEFVLVDGGSQDGTIEWCRQQNDVNLIKHGRLMGAVKAFNDGSFAAKGNYVVLGNDDIEFLGQSILTAFLYMQIHYDCGMGCFYQDRERQNLPDTDPNKWHVSVMPVAYRGRQNWMPYGQVCMVPKWLGDKVGWWGDYLHTYGGDNELSAQIYELGFKVSPVPGTKISDHEAQDGLRAINNFGHGSDPKKTGGHHPDSWAWGRKWQFPDRRDEATGQIMTGPTVREKPYLENITPLKPRFVYLPIYEQGWAVQKEQKKGLREALEKVGLCWEYDYIQRNTELGKQGMFQELINLLGETQPNIVLTQIHNGEIINSDDIRELRQLYPFQFVNWNGDYWPENLLSEQGLKLARAFHYQLGINREAIEKQRQNGVNAHYWQIGYESVGVGHEATDFCDVVFLASGYSQARQDLVKKLRGLNCTFHLYGPGWKEGSKGVTIYDFKRGCQIYQGAKISIGDSQWPETGFVSNRVFQALAAGGSALAHQYFKDMDKLGLIDGETCIIWQDFKDLEFKIYYYLQHESERKKIATRGQEMCLARHSFEVRVKELFDILNLKFEMSERQSIVVQESWR